MNDSRHGTPTTPVEPDSVCIAGPWRHCIVSTNGIHLHIADALPENWEENHPPSELPPLVLLLHGYAENWWGWHNQLVPIAQAGFHAIAVDLRGYGNSDKPPRGYDLHTAATDMAGLVRATGHRNVIVIGHGLGGIIGWTMAQMFPRSVTKLIVVGSPHPLVARAALMRDIVSSTPDATLLLGAQLPRLPEQRMRQPEWIANYLGCRVGDGWLDTPAGAEALRVLASALSVANVGYCANEYLRWMGRSLLRPDGFRYAQQMKHTLTLPVIAMRGENDPTTSLETLQKCRRYAQKLQVVTVPQCGFYPQLEVPHVFSELLLHYLGTPQLARNIKDTPAGP